MTPPAAPPPEPLPIAVMISGGGTTLQNLIDRIRAGRLPARIVQVISNNPKALGNARAAAAGLPLEVVRRRDHATLQEFSERVFAAVRRSAARMVCMAGFLQLLKIPADFAGRVINIHPSLLPAFGGQGMYGIHVHEAVLRAGVPESGCTVHLVDDQYDHGEVLLQRRVPVLPGDTPEALAARVFEQECEAFPEVIRRFAGG